MDGCSRARVWALDTLAEPSHRVDVLCCGLPASPAAASSALCSPEPCKNQPQSRKHSVSKSLKHLFHPGSKFLKMLKR